MAGTSSKRNPRGRPSEPEAPPARTRKVQFGGADEEADSSTSGSAPIELNPDVVKALISDART